MPTANNTPPQGAPEAPVDLSFLPDPPLPGGQRQDAGGDDMSFLPDQKPHLESVYQQASRVDPEHAAKVVELSKRLNEPMAFVDKNLPQVQKAAQAPGTSFFKELEEKYPETAKWLSDPQNMAPAHDDLQNLAQHEQLVKQASEARTLMESLRAGWQQSVTGLAVRNGLPDLVLAHDHNALDSLAYAAGGLAGDFPEMALGAAAGTAGGAAAGSLAGPLGAAAGAVAGGGAGGFGLPAAIRKNLMELYAKGQIRSASDFWERTKDALEEGMKQGVVGAVTSSAAALTAGAVSPLTAKLALGGAGSRFLGKAVGTAAPLGAEVTAMTGTQGAVEGKMPTRDDLLENMIMVGGLHAAHASTPYVLNLFGAQKMVDAQAFYQAMGDTAEASKLRERLPDAYRDYVAAITKDGPVESVHIPLERFEEHFQSKGLSPDRAAEQLGATDSLAEARKTGGSVQIPLADFAAKVAGTEHFQGLKDDVKFSEDDFTPREFEERKKAIDERVKELMQEQAKAAEGKPDGEEPQDQVGEAVREQLEKAGMSKGEQKAGAALWQARYEQLAKSLSEASGREVTPMEAFQRFPLDVNREYEAGAPGVRDMEQGSLNEPRRKIEEDLATRLSDKPIPETIRVPELKTDSSFQGMEPEEIEKQSREDSKKLSRGKIKNADQEWDVSLSGEGPKKSANYALRSEQAIGVRNLHTLIEHGVYLRAEKKPGGITHDYLYAPFVHDGEWHVAKLVVENPKPQPGRKVEPKKFYSLHVVKVDSPLEGSTIRRPPEGEAPQGTSGLTVSKADLLRLVNEAREKTTDRFQGGEGDGPRGRIRFMDDAANGFRSFITLFKGADRSTFLHETGHQFLEVMDRVSRDENAPEDIKSDMATIREWLGAKEGEALTREQHEKWAQGFEKYLMEGKAPTEGLRAAFRRFKSWLIGVYEDARNLKVELSPEVRDVMDRMLGSRDEIEKARREVGMDDLPLDQLPDDVKAKLKSLQDQARSHAEEALLKEQMNEITEKRQAEVTAERERLTKEATKEVKELPLYKAQAELRRYLGKNAAEVANRFPEDRVNDDTASAFEEAAELHGFASGSELAQKIIESETQDGLNREIKSRVDAGLAKYAPLMERDAVRLEALKVIHDSRTGELLALERESLLGLADQAATKGEATRRNRIEAALAAKAATEQAKALLEKRPVKDATNAMTYFTAERKAAEKVSRALLKKDFEAAAKAKDEQLLNHALAREAMRNKVEAEKTVDYLKGAIDRADLTKMPYAFTRQVSDILSRYGLAEERPEDIDSLEAIAQNMFRRHEDAGEIANATGLVRDGEGKWQKESILGFVSRLNDDFTAIELPKALLLADGRTFRQLRMGELRDLKATVQTLLHLGRDYNGFLNAFIKADRKAAAKEIAERIQKVVGTPYASRLGPGKPEGSSKMGDGLRNLFNADAFIPSMVNVLTIAKFLDGADDGPVHQYLYRPMKMAEDSKFTRYEKMRTDLNDLMGKFFKPKELKDYKNERFTENGRVWTKEEALAMALNWGNEGNRDRIREGFRYEDSHVEAVLSHLEKRDWDFVQASWDYLDSFWPEVKELEMRVRGVDPEKVENAKVTTPHGDYPGGYYPIAYDFERSTEAFRNAEQRTELYRTHATTYAQTDRGHAIARVSTVDRPVRLSLDVLFNHLENVVHDLEFRPSVVDVSRLIRQPEVRDSLTNALGVRGANAINDWLKGIAQDQGEVLSAADKAFRWFRFNATFATLGYRALSFGLHGAGNVVNGVWEIGPSRMASAMKDFVLSPLETKHMVEEKSIRMKQRATTLDRDIMDVARKYQGKQSMFRQWAFIFTSMADESVSFPLWAETYKRELGKHGDETKAVNIADETVTRTIGSGTAVDRVGAQRGSEATKILSMYYSWMNMMFNRAWLSGKMAGLEVSRGNVGNALAITAKAAFFAWGLQAANEIFWHELIHNAKSEDDDERTKRIASHVLQQPFAYLLIARDIGGLVADKAVGKKNADYRLSPVEDAVKSVFAPIGDGIHIALTEGKEFDQKYAEEVARGAAIALGYPNQVNNAAFNLLDWSAGNGELTWRDFLKRRTLK